MTLCAYGFVVTLAIQLPVFGHLVTSVFNMFNKFCVLCSVSGSALNIGL